MVIVVLLETKTVREGEGERRKKYLARKQEEAKEATLKGLEPEVCSYLYHYCAIVHH